MGNLTRATADAIGTPRRGLSGGLSGRRMWADWFAFLLRRHLFTTRERPDRLSPECSSAYEANSKGLLRQGAVPPNQPTACPQSVPLPYLAVRQCLLELLYTGVRHAASAEKQVPKSAQAVEAFQPGIRDTSMV